MGGFCEAIETAELSNAFDEGNWTIFAPHDGAMYRAPEVFLDLVREDASDTELLANYLLYHTSPNNLLRKYDLPCQAGVNLVAMGNDRDSRTLCVDQVPTYQKGKGNHEDDIPQIIEFDIEACNGIIHIVDRVLMYDSSE